MLSSDSNTCRAQRQRMNWNARFTTPSLIWIMRFIQTPRMALVVLVRLKGALGRRKLRPIAVGDLTAKEAQDIHQRDHVAVMPVDFFDSPGADVLLFLLASAPIFVQPFLDALNASLKGFDVEDEIAGFHSE